ncbi:MAG: four helix bundle protein [Cytophagales bacterium]|nr:four helix bundle protein [Cytophagales bacterium]
MKHGKRQENSVKLYILLLNQGALKNDFALREQMRRSTISIMANIAEGFERGGNKEFIQFLTIAKASAGETKAHLYIARDLNYLNSNDFIDLYDKLDKISKMLGGLISYLRKSDYLGPKFK